MKNVRSCAVTIMVTDLDTSIEFYTNVLGFTLKSRYGNHWADIDAPGLTIGLHPSSKKERTRGENMQIGIQVTNLKEAASELHKRGVHIQIGNDSVKILHFKDPDQNHLYLIEAP